MSYKYKNYRIALLLSLAILLILPGKSLAQQTAISPAIFTSETEITVTFNVTGNSLANEDDAWLWSWIPNENIDARSNINPAGSNSELTDPVKLTKSVSNGQTTFSLSFVPQDLFDEDISEVSTIGMLVKGNDWGDGQSSDFVASFFIGDYTALLTAPLNDPFFVETNEQFTISAEASEVSDFELFINNVSVDQQSDVSMYSYLHTVVETEGLTQVRLVATAGEFSQELSFSYVLRTATVEQSRPAGIIEGINYGSDDTKATLCLRAPFKQSVFVLTESNDFKVSPDYQMFKDGEFFWLEISDLEPGVEYAFQYLVDESVKVADPYADKILDPDDRWIPESIYPNLKPFPENALSSTWHANRLAVIQTAQEDYTWQVTDFQKPDKEDLIIYELLIRDFFGPEHRSYQTLIDTLGYFKRLGVNAIELMPVMEFNGNDSWGYNTTFMFAPDKAYGTKDQLKAFVDAAHQHGIAVILDIVLNHQDIPNPFALMYFDGSAPTAENPWFNTQAKHPFNVFFDMDHESTYTQHYMDTSLHYWINEFKVDGFRFDLSKGFTQVDSGDDVGLWSSRDDSRIDLLKRMADVVWSYAPDTYIMLEHFADNQEETILANYGMMLWGNLHFEYREAMKGNASGRTIDWAWYQRRNWSQNNLITYFESHDEERQMYDMLEFGRVDGSYSVRNLDVALERKKMAAAFLFGIPGSKLFWQFGELGYDVPINFNGRTGTKPVLWEYYDDPDRLKLYKVFGEIIKFRNENEAFKNGTFNWKPIGTFKNIRISSNDMDILIAGNFDTRERNEIPGFTKTGTWYDFFTGAAFQVNNTSETMLFQPGQFHILTTKKIDGIEEDLVPWKLPIITSLAAIEKNIAVYPNPTSSNIHLQLPLEVRHPEISISDMYGRKVSKVTIQQDIDSGSFEVNTSNLAPGVYHLEVYYGKEKLVKKFIKN